MHYFFKYLFIFKTDGFLVPSTIWSAIQTGYNEYFNVYEQFLFLMCVLFSLFLLLTLLMFLQWVIDSAAIIDYHTGKNPDRRAQKCMKNHDVPMDHKARPVQTADFEKFDYIFGMDEDNMRYKHNLINLLY